jgi:transposase, IS5 family
MQEIQPHGNARRQTATYRELIGIAEEVIDSARAALRQTPKARGKDRITDLAIAATRGEIEHVCALGAFGEEWPNWIGVSNEKLYEPHTNLIKRAHTD